jgi:oligopeptide transport system ATP-binding protein
VKILSPALKLLEVNHLQVHFAIARGWSASKLLKAVDDVSFDLAPGETVGLVGESGCGKTTLGRTIVRLEKPLSGNIIFDGTDIGSLAESSLRSYRRHFQMIFQDPQGTLNPQLTIGQSLAEPLEIHEPALNAARRKIRLGEMLSAVGLEAGCLDRYPHEFSGGQRQRIGIARALAVNPRLLVCDEPVSALDVSVQAQIVNLLQDLQQKLNLSMLFISHDLAVVEHISHRIMVMYLGKLVEVAESQVVCRSPLHPYTQALLSAVPSRDPSVRTQRIILSGDVPSPIHPPSGCPFHPRCPRAELRCSQEIPELRKLNPGHQVRCHLI